MKSLTEQVRADFARHGGELLNIAWWPLFVYRLGVWSLSLSPPARFITSKIYYLMYFLVHLFTGASIVRETRIGEELALPHSGNIIIHPDCVVGDRCAIFHEVTLGTTIDKEGAPRLGDDVFIGPGAKVLGPVTIGDGARIAANSLVITDVPAGAIAIGVPARAFAAPRSGAQVAAARRERRASQGRGTEPTEEPSPASEGSAPPSSRQD